MRCCLRRDGDSDYERMRAMVSRYVPEIERKWFTIRILVSLTSVVLSLIAVGVGIYLFPTRWPHVVWGGIFLALFAFMVNMGVGVLINKRVKMLITKEYETRYGLPGPKSSQTSEDLQTAETRALVHDAEEDSDSDFCPPPEDLENVDLYEPPSGSLNTMDALVGGLHVALGSPRPIIQQIRTTDAKPIPKGDRVIDESNSFDPLQPKLLPIFDVASLQATPSPKLFRTVK